MNIIGRSSVLLVLLRTVVHTKKGRWHMVSVCFSVFKLKSFGILARKIGEEQAFGKIVKANQQKRWR